MRNDQLSALAIFFLITVALAFTRTFYLPLFGARPAMPDLMMVYVIVSSLWLGPTMAARSGFLVGLTQDLLSNSFFGIGAISKGMTALIIGALAPSIRLDRAAMVAALSAVATLFEMALFGVAILYVFKRDPTSILLAIAPERLALNIIFSVLALPLARALFQSPRARQLIDSLERSPSMGRRF